eukprot:jgi/Bigna1/89558/estExt_fgenesh1_pg.C_510112
METARDTGTPENAVDHPTATMTSGDTSGQFWNVPELLFSSSKTQKVCLVRHRDSNSVNENQPDIHSRNNRDSSRAAATSLLRPGFRRTFDHAFPDLRDFYSAAELEEAFESMSRDMRRHEQLLTRSPMTGSPRKRQKTVEIPIAKESASDAKRVTDANNEGGKVSTDATADKSVARNEGFKDIFSNESSDDWFTGLPSSSSLLQRNEEADQYTFTLDKAIGDIKCSVRDNNLYIKGEKEENYDNGYYKESFTRSFSLPPNIETDEAKAELVDGKLSINIPKSIPSKMEKEETTRT